MTAKLAVTAVMLATLFAIGMRRRDFFLAVGDLTAPIRPVPALGFSRADSWRRFGIIWGFGIAAVLGIVQFLLLRPPASAFVAILPMVPGGLFGAVASIFMGWILSKAMLDTRGLFWPWFIHFLSDIVIFAFLALALVDG